MAVTFCKLERTEGTTAYDKTNYAGTYQLNYRVETDAAMSHRAVINGALTAAPNALPALWSTYSHLGATDTAAYALNFSVTSDPASVLRYFIAVDYRPLEPGEHSSESNPNPFARPAVVWWEPEVFTRIVDSDQAGNKITNAVGHPYDEPIEEEATRGVLVVEFPVATLTEVIGYSRGYERAVNSVAWSVLGYTAPARTVLCRQVVCGPPVTEGTYKFYQLAMKFAFADAGETWDRLILERGYQHWTKTGTAYDKKDGENKLTDAGAEPILLARDGTKLGDNLPGIFTTWRVYREVPFTALAFIA